MTIINTNYVSLTTEFTTKSEDVQSWGWSVLCATSHCCIYAASSALVKWVKMLKGPQFWPAWLFETELRFFFKKKKNYYYPQPKHPETRPIMDEWSAELLRSQLSTWNHKTHLHPYNLNYVFWNFVLEKAPRLTPCMARAECLQQL